LNLLTTPPPKVSHRGQLLIADIRIDCAVLDNGMRVLTASSILKAFGCTAIEESSGLEILSTKLPLFLAKNNLERYVNQYFIFKYKPIFYLDNKQKKTAYNANLLPKLCGLYLLARRNGDLYTTQIKIATRSEIILSTLAQVGIMSLIDEVTGYQIDRRHEALRILITSYIPKEFQKLIELLSDSFYTELDWLYSSSHKHFKSLKRPQEYARFIKKYIFEEIESEFIINNLDVVLFSSNLDCKSKFHYWLSSEGVSSLLSKIHFIQELMKKYSNIRDFRFAMSKQKLIFKSTYNYDLDKMVSSST
jgi:hypothetical protein